MFFQAAILALLEACATKAPPAALAPAPAVAAAAPVRLAVLPPDTFLFADVAAALGERLARVQIGGAGPAVMTKVSMEVAQLSLECVAPTDDCFTKVGRFLRVDRLLWGQIGRDQGGAGVKVRVVYLDVDRAVSLGQAERTFPAPAEAIRGLQDLVDQAIQKRSAPTVAARAPAAYSPAEMSR